MPGQHCSSTLAQHSIYRLQKGLYECWWLSAPIIIRQIYWKLFLQCFECYVRSTLQINTSTTFDLSFKTVLYECWLLSAPIIIRRKYRKLFLHWFECYVRSTLQINTSTTYDLSFKTILYECWLLSAPIIIRRICRICEYDRHAEPSTFG